MRRWLRRRRLQIVVVLFLIIALQLTFFQPARDLARRIIGYPATMLTAQIDRIGRVAEIIRTLDTLEKENVELRQQLNELTARKAETETVKLENQQLRQDLGFTESRPELQLLPAPILGFIPEYLGQAFMIGLGRRDGITSGQAVISSGFLIGRIGSVSDSTAEVLLLSNRNVVVPVILARSGSTGLLRGSVRGLIVDTVPQSVTVEVGELITTSNLEGKYPDGIAVGKVEQVIAKPEEVFLSVRVTSPVSLSRVRTVFVVR